VGSARSRFSAAPRPTTPTGFSKFSDLEMTSGMDRWVFEKKLAFLQIS